MCAETLIAQATPERLGVQVDDHVTIQAAVSCERRLAHVTFKRLHTCREDRESVKNLFSQINSLYIYIWSDTHLPADYQCVCSGVI